MTEGEKAVLRALADQERRVTAAELAEMLGQKNMRVVSILNSLSQKGLASLEIREIASYTLTQEGTEYAENGLPEVRLFRAVLELGGKAKVDEAVAKSGLTPAAKGIAINWSRKNGWLGITKEDGTTVLEVKAEVPETPLEEVLSAISEGRRAIPEGLDSALEEAIERSLANTSMTKVFEAEVTREKRDMIDELLSKEIQGIVNLTSEMLSSESWRGKPFRPYNVELEPAYVNYGKKHPYAEFNDWLREIMIGLGFTEWFGPYVETEFWGHDTLFVPQDHVSREVQDQFRVVSPHDHGDILDDKYYKAVKAVHENGGDTGSKGWDWPFSKEVATRLCLRPHTTPVSMRYLYEHRESPQKMFIIDRNFRAEKLDATHGQEFDQCEGIIMDKDLTLRDLLGYLTSICKGVGIKKMKFKPGQFPFTEPSVETFAKHDKLGWIELGGSGIFRPEVTYPVGIKDTVLAWGIGSGRLYMAAMGINDIRDLFTRDLTWLRRSAFVA
ncbi:MAG: phenylalanine--tRNA ligase subunit alpha [Candidatus Thorarchaeota archaeon]|nr:MAG: phenylalanine--tRNA ligase subunit alpha [Candidatus Thorarchaeota archaeon]